MTGGNVAGVVWFESSDVARSEMELVGCLPGNVRKARYTQGIHKGYIRYNILSSSFCS